MLITFAKQATIPDRLNDFYEAAFTTLFNEHDATKDAYKRDIRTGLSCEDFKRVFAHFCFKSYFREEYEFTEAKLHGYIHDAKEKIKINNFKVEDFQDDLLHSVCMLVKDGLNYSFSHRSFQEYFAAWYTCKLTDDVVARFLLEWLKKSNSINSDSYLTMLYDMQSERVSKIVFCPILKEVKAKYEQHGGFTRGFVSELLGIGSMPVSNSNTEELRADFYISNSLTMETLILVLRLNKYDFKYGIKQEQTTAKKIRTLRRLDYL